VADLFRKCFEFREKTRIIADQYKEVAEKIFMDTSPIENYGPRMVKDGKEFLQFSTNDYLGMTRHPDVRRAALEMVEKYGISAPMGARPLTGTTPLHLELEAEVADFKRTEASVTFSTGADAMIGAVASLFGPKDLIVADQYAHTSLLIGARVSRAELKIFRHNDVKALEKTLAQAEPGRAKGVVIDGVYSMHGDIAPIPEIVEIKNKYGARLIVDDAHGTGVNGENGRGTAERTGGEEGVDLHLGTFSKAFATSGGFAAGAAEVIFYVRFNAPTMLFTKSMSAAVAAATLASIRAARKEPERRRTLWENTKFLQDGIRELGFPLSTQTPITPLRMKGTAAVLAAAFLREKHGIWAAAVTYPAIRFGTSILRIIPTTNHSKEDIRALLHGLSDVRREIPESVAPARG